MKRNRLYFFFLLSLLLFALCAGRAGTTNLLEGQVKDAVSVNR